MNSWNNLIRRMLALVLCLSLLLASAAALGEAAANVTDAEAPKLTNFIFTQDGKTLKPGDKINVSVRATDRSGIDYVEVSFYSLEEEDNALWVYLRYDAETDVYRGERTLSESLASGTYTVGDIYTRDQFGNTKNVWSYSKNGPLGKFKFKGVTVKDLKATIRLDKNGKRVKPDDRIKVSVAVESKLTDPRRVSVTLSHKIDSQTSSELTIYCYLNSETGKYEGEFAFGYVDSDGVVYCDHPAGKYSVTEAVAYNSNNAKIAKKKVSSGNYVTLKYDDDRDDEEGPVISAAKIKQKGKSLKAGKTVRVEATVKDDSEISYVEAYLSMEGEYSYDEAKELHTSTYHNGYWFRLTKKSGNVWQGDLTLPQDMVNGKYYLHIEAADEYGNSTWANFPKQYFKFNGKDYVTDGIRSFLVTIYNGIKGTNPSESQIEKLGLKMASGKMTGVEAVNSVLSGEKLSRSEKIKVLYSTMKGSAPTDSELKDWKTKLKAGTSVKALIDELAKSKNFRTLCNDCQVMAGSFSEEVKGVEIGEKSVSEIKLNKKKATLRLSKSSKKTVTLSATVTPKNAVNTSVSWTSSDPSVAKVDSKGKVTAVGKGTCVITCEAKDGSGTTATCKITVKK